MHVSRRRFLSLAAAGPAAATLSGLLPRAVAQGPATELCLIFPGSWLFLFEPSASGKVQIRAVSPDFSEHNFHFGRSDSSTVGTRDLLQNVAYTVDVPGASSALTPAELVQPLLDDRIGFVYSQAVQYVGDKRAATLRSITFPLPDSITPAGVSDETPVSSEPSQCKQGLVPLSMPAAYVFRYTHARSAALNYPGGSYSIKAREHLQFRTVLKRFDDPTMGCASCGPQDPEDAMHENMAFDGIMKLLSFPAGTTPPAVHLTSICHGHMMPQVPGVDRNEYGMIPMCPSQAKKEPKPTRRYPTEWEKGIGDGACGNSGGFYGG